MWLCVVIKSIKVIIIVTIYRLWCYIWVLIIPLYKPRSLYILQIILLGTVVVLCTREKNFMYLWLQLCDFVYFYGWKFSPSFSIVRHWPSFMVDHVISIMVFHMNSCISSFHQTLVVFNFLCSSEVYSIFTFLWLHQIFHESKRMNCWRTSSS